MSNGSFMELEASSIWWDQVGSSLVLLRRLRRCFGSDRSVVLHTGGRLPWRQTFAQRLRLEAGRYGDGRSLNAHPAGECADPGDYLMNDYCSAKERQAYFPSQSSAEYLVSLRGQLLHQELVWVENIRTPAALQRWAEFVRQYEKAARRADLDRQAMFLLEYAGPAREIPGLEPVRYALGEYDCHVFCLEAAGELEGPDWLRQYMAELALRLGGGDPERCAALLAVGETLARDPLTAAADLPDPMEREDAESAVRRAQIVQVFPVLEEYRMELIDRRRELLEDRLCRSPRVLDSEGKPVTEVQELEIAALRYIVRGSDRFSGAEAHHLDLCRDVRNQLAHNDQVPFEEVKRLMEEPGF